MTLNTFFEKFALFADAPDAVGKMRELVLELAVQGKLVEQKPEELSAQECIRNANKPVIDVATDESIQTPAGWVALPLGCLIASNTGGGTPSKANPNYWNGTIPWASVKDIQSEKYLISTIDSITEAGLKDSSSNLIPPGRLLVVTRMGLGKLAINKAPVAINQDLRAIEPTKALDLDFAYLLFKSLKMVGSGVTVKGITVEKLHAMHVMLPPLAEQKRIVAKVDELMALCDRLEAQQQEREQQHTALSRASLSRFAEAPTPANLQLLFHKSYTISPADLRKSILTLAVQGKLVAQDPNDEPAETLCQPDEELAAVSSFEVPHGWIWTRLAKLAEINGGFAFKSTAYTEEGTRVVRISDFDEFGFKDHKVVRHPFSADLQKFTLEEQNILMAMTGGTVGKSYFIRSMPEPMVVNQRVATIKVSGSALPSYIDIVIRSEMTQAVIRKAKNSTNDNISMGDIKGFTIPLPPLAEQRRIVAKVEQLMALVDALETQLAASRATAKNLLDALVAELTNGSQKAS
jgi:type I restriction enzyme S subunit